MRRRRAARGAHRLPRVTAPSVLPEEQRRTLTPNSSLTLVLTRLHVLPKELRHARLAAQQGSARQLARRARLRDELAQVRRLSMCAARVQDVAVHLGAPPPPARRDDRPASVVLPLAPGGKVLIFLPHCHATPDETLACLRFFPTADAESTAAAWRAAASISVVQLPCCGYVWHDTLLGQPADVDFLDARVCTTARSVRVWRNAAAAFDFRASACGPGVPVGRLSVLARDGETQARKRQEHRQVRRAKDERKSKQKAERERRSTHHACPS